MNPQWKEQTPQNCPDSTRTPPNNNKTVRKEGRREGREEMDCVSPRMPPLSLQPRRKSDHPEPSDAAHPLLVCPTPNSKCRARPQNNTNQLLCFDSSWGRVPWEPWAAGSCLNWQLRERERERRDCVGLSQAGGTRLGTSFIYRAVPEGPGLGRAGPLLSHHVRLW